MQAETIVVGAGSSGAVIAARATERADREVLLVEAGPDYPPSVTLPSDLVDGTRNSMTAHDWGFSYLPMPGHKPFVYPRGRVVGGSSAVNTCIALRGQPYDYDEWAALGLPEWSFEACLPALKRLEDDQDVQNRWHGRGGPIPIRRHPPEELAPFQVAFMEACRALGFPACPDQNDPDPFGVGPQPMNKIGGVRMSAARRYLGEDVRRRDNLTIRPRTSVRRVLFHNGKVTGLEVETSGKIEVLATNRVVLAAGAIATPGILIRSGIGPRDLLERLGVDVVSDIPAIGARLLDHPGSLALFVPKTYGFARTQHPLIQTVLRYTSEGSPFPSDMQLQPFSFFAWPGNYMPLVGISCCVGKPRGHGRITWTSADPAAKPRIELDVILHPDDRACAVEAMELAGQVARTKPLRDLVVPFWPNDRVLRNRAEISRWIEWSSGSGYHPSGTVPMGREGDPEAAVDGRGHVRGVSGLVVADASIMPTIVSTNTNVTALMIGERFGEWLRNGGL
ncbi:MAG TPA: GMC family oxidoreductase N-terminal domain-containing protein [Polyangium sp.]|nr:GMC family oxidoreductase N-terminal domain-containing protein [Polyangium sp.]